MGSSVWLHTLAFPSTLKEDKMLVATKVLLMSVSGVAAGFTTRVYANSDCTGAVTETLTETPAEMVARMRSSVQTDTRTVETSGPTGNCWTLDLTVETESTGQTVSGSQQMSVALDDGSACTFAVYNTVGDCSGTADSSSDAGVCNNGRITECGDSSSFAMQVVPFGMGLSGLMVLAQEL